jgi:NADPH:quinone reductase-like Zn-dependent oxidoreductase
MRVFGKDKQENKKQTPRSPLEQLLSSFTEQSKRMNAILGFPGVLLLMAIVFAALPAVTRVNPSSSFTVLAAASLVGSVVTYLANWYYSLRHAEAQAQIVSDYMRLFLDKYLASLGSVTAENVLFGIDHIFMPLFTKREAALSAKP